MPNPPFDRRTFLRRTLVAAATGPIVLDVSTGGLAVRGAFQGTQDVAWGFLNKYVDGWLPLDTAASEAAWVASTDVSAAHTAEQVKRGARGQPHCRCPGGHRDEQGPARAQGPARWSDRPSAREGPAPRRRGAGDDPGGRRGADRGRGGAVGPPGWFRVRAARSPAARGADHRQRNRPRADRVARPARAARRVGGVEDHRRPAARRFTAAPRPAEPGRPRAGVRQLLRLAGCRLWHDRPRDARPDRQLPRRGPAAVHAASHLGQTRAGETVRGRRARGDAPRPLAAEPLGPELAGAGRGGRHGRPLPGQDQGVHRRAGRAFLRLARVPEAAPIVLREVGPVPGAGRLRPQEELARLGLAHRPPQGRAKPDVGRAEQPLVHHRAPRTRAHLLLSQLRARPRCRTCFAAGPTGRSTRAWAT